MLQSLGLVLTGALTAYFSARASLATTLIERGEIGGQASSNNPGGLNPLHGPGIPGPMGGLALYAFELHKNNWAVFDEHSCVDFAPRETSRIQLLQEDGADNGVTDIIDLYEGTNGFSARILDRKDLVSEEPRLHPEITCGIMLCGNARIDAHTYTLAVTEAAISYGAVVEHDSAVGLADDEGLTPCYSASAAVAGLARLAREGTIHNNDNILVNLSGSDQVVNPGISNVRRLIRERGQWLLENPVDERIGELWETR